MSGGLLEVFLAGCVSVGWEGWEPGRMLTMIAGASRSEHMVPDGWHLLAPMVAHRLFFVLFSSSAHFPHVV